jgi:hypothetical protein
MLIRPSSLEVIGSTINLPTPPQFWQRVQSVIKFYILLGMAGIFITWVAYLASTLPASGWLKYLYVLWMAIMAVCVGLILRGVALNRGPALDERTETATMNKLQARIKICAFGLLLVGIAIEGLLRF